MHLQTYIVCQSLESAQCYKKFLVVGMPGETAQAICCMIFGGVLERHPNLKVCFAHGGKKNNINENLILFFFPKLGPGWRSQ